MPIKFNPHFHFHIPEFSSYSNGIKTLWEAAYEFNKFYPTTITYFHYGGLGESVPSKYMNLVRNQIDTNKTVVIYPDCINGNPLQAKNAARFLMAKPMILNGENINFGVSDFFFSYSYAANKELPQYNLILEELLHLRKINSKKDLEQVSIYYGKCRIGSEFKKDLNLIAKYFKKFKIITRTHPSNHEILYQNISESGLFVTLDPLTSLSYESTLLGTPSLILDSVFKSQYDEFNYPLYDFYYDVDKAISGMETTNRLIINKELDNQLSLNSNKTRIIIEKIINHFSQETILSNYTNHIKISDENFYEKLWKKAPIFNCTNINSIIKFHLINNNIYTYILVKLLIKIKNLLLKIPKVLLIYILGKEDYSYIEYIKGKGKFRNPDKNNLNINNLYADIISISRKKLKLLWRI